MNCPSCGNQVQTGDSFCMHCGAYLTNSAQFPAGSAAAAGPLPAEPAPPPEAFEFGSQPQAGSGTTPSFSGQGSSRDSGSAAGSPPSAERRPSSAGRWLGLIALLLVLFGLAAAGGYLLQRKVFPEEQAGDAPPAESALDQPPGERAAMESGQPEGQPRAADPTTQDPSGSGVPAPSGTSATAAASGVTASEATTTGVTAGEGSSNTSRPGGNRKDQPASATVEPAASGGASVSQGATTPKSQVSSSLTRPPVETGSTATATRPAVADRVSSPPGTVAEQPRPESGEQKAQPQSSAPSETTVAAATETADTPPGQRAPRNTRVLKPEGQPSPPSRPAASQPAAPSAAVGGLQPRAPAPAPQAREEGIIYWTGRLTKNQVIVIEQDKATAGMAEGSLPATPVDVWLPSPAVVLVERPTSRNNWSRVAFRCLQSTNRSVTLNIQWKRLR